jgi:hypothetical protein
MDPMSLSFAQVAEKLRPAAERRFLGSPAHDARYEAFGGQPPQLLPDVIRDELGLDVLRAPWSADQVAHGYVLTDVDDDGCRALSADGSAIATARKAL